MSVGLFINQIKSLYYGFVGWFVPVIFSAGIYIYDFKHYPNYAINITTPIPTTNQLYVEDIQLDVKYVRDSNGAILGYIGDDGLIDKTNYVAHVSLEGSIMIFSRDDAPTGMFVVVIPFNTHVKHLLPDGEALEIVPMEETAQRFTTSKVRWRGTDVPGHWFADTPTRLGIETKWNREDNYPYVEHIYYLRNVSRYDDKRFQPKFVANGIEIDSYRTNGSPQVNSAEFSHALDQACFYISMIKRKYDVEPLTFNNFLKPY